MTEAGRINYLVVAVLFLCIAYFSIGYDKGAGFYIETHYQNARVPLSWSATELADWAGGSDVGTYIKSALYYMDNGEFEDWVANLFPPGQMYYLVFLLETTGESYLPLKILLTSLFAWMLVFLVATWILNRRFAHVSVPFFVLSPMLFSGIREYVFGYGILGAEMLAMPLFVLLVYMVLLFSEKLTSLKYLSVVALILALLSYMRGYFEIFGNFIVVLLLFVLLLNLVFRVCQYHAKGEGQSGVRDIVKQVVGNRRLVFPLQLRSIAVMLIIFMLLLLPWRLSNVERGFTMSWLHAGYYWSLVWTSDEDVHPSFRNTGINTPCRTDPALCEVLSAYENSGEGQSIPFSMYGKQAILTFVTNPITWYKNKLAYFDNLWFGNNGWQYELREHKWKFVGGVFLLVSPLFFYLYYLVRWDAARQGYKDLWFASAVFVLFNVMLFTLLHFETRYSIFLKLLFAVLFALVLHDWLGGRKGRKAGLRRVSNPDEVSD